MGDATRAGPKVHRINPADNVATALSDLSAGEVIPIEGQVLVVLTTIPFGHKMALVDITEGAAVIKYGEPIGRATRRITAGEHVHVHNVVTLRGIRTATEE